MRPPFVLLLLMVNSILDWVNLVLSDDNQVYQPTKQEIERFQVIQEQIRHHQQEEQRERERKKKLAYEEMERQQLESQVQPRHPAESLLIPHSALVPMFMHRQQQHSDHRVPMPPLLSGPQPFGFGPAPVPPPSNQYHQQALSPIIQEVNHINDPYIEEKVRQMSIRMNNHAHHRNIGHLDSSNNHKHHRKHYREDREEDFDKIDKHHMDPEMSDSSRLDKNRHPGEETSRHGPPFRCYYCQWNIAQCSDFNCYNNPDICTTNNFVPHMVQQADCPGGCEQFVITDPNGLTQQWKRGCAQAASLPIQRMRCQTYYEFGVRIDRCVCNTDWCNGTWKNGQSSKWFAILITMVSITIILVL